MGGVILEMESDKIWNAGWDKGWNTAWDTATKYTDWQKRIFFVENAMKKLNMTLEEACEFSDITVDDYYKAIELVKAAEEEHMSKMNNAGN